MTTSADESAVQALPLLGSPGFLLRPFGWADQSLAGMVCAEPALSMHLLAIDRTRMHAIALVLAHLDDNGLPQFAQQLAQASLTDMLAMSLRQRPKGIRRALAHLPDTVLKRESYRRLVQLLDDPECGRLLHHRAVIDEATITTLFEIPAILRRVVLMAEQEQIERLAGLSEAL